MAVNITASQTVTLVNDLDADGVADPGETLEFQVVIENTGADAATGVTFQEDLDDLITLVPGTINVSPVAADDSYGAVGNVPLTVTADAGLLDNDTDFLLDTSQAVSSINGVGGNVGNPVAISGGSVTVLADGSFTFTPTAGFTGTASFDYTTTDSGGLSSQTATVEIEVGPAVWFIDNTAPGSSNIGTQDNPFTSIDAFNQAQGDPGGPQPGDVVYLRAGTYTEADGINLTAGQTLIGQGQDLVVTPSAPGSTPMTIETGSQGQTPVIVVTGANQGIQLSTNNTISGLDVGMNNASAVGIADGGGTVGTLTITDVGVGVSSSLGGAVDIDQGGTLNVQLNSITSTGASVGIDLGTTNGLSGTGNHFTVSGTTTVDDTGIAGMRFGNSSLNATFTGKVTMLNDGGTPGSGVVIGTGAGGTNTGTTSFNGGIDVTVNGGDATAFDARNAGTVNATDSGTTQLVSNAGTAMNVASSTLGMTLDQVTSTGDTATNGGISLNTMSGSLTISSVDIDGQNGDGIDITSSSGAVTINGGTIGGGNDVDGIGIDINGGSGNVSIGASVTDITAGDIVEVTGRTGGTVTLSGNLSTTGGVAAGIDVNSNPAERSTSPARKACRPAPVPR